MGLSPPSSSKTRRATKSENSMESGLNCAENNSDISVAAAQIISTRHSALNFYLDFFITQKAQREQQEANNFKVFILLEAFLNLCYCLLLIPFRIAPDSKGLYQIFSTLLVSIITLFSLLDLRHYAKEYNLHERPDQTFQYATIFIVHWIPICWMCVFWLRQDRFPQLLDVCQTRFIEIPESQCDRSRDYSAPYFRILKWACLLKLMICLMEIKNVLLIYNEVLSEGSLGKYLDSQGKRLIYDIWLENNTIIMENPEIFSTITHVATVLRFILEFVIYMFDQWCFTAAAMVFITCQHFLEDFQKVASIQWKEDASSGQMMEHKLKKIFTSYLDMMTILNGCNKIYGICIVMFFMYLYPLFIWSVFESGHNTSLIDNIIKVHDLSMLCLVTIIAAEASSKVEPFKHWLFETAVSNITCGSIIDGSYDALLRLTTMHREVSSEAVGLKGYKFFTVTYRFVATIIGVVITYAIVMFQFVMDPRKAQVMNSSRTSSTTIVYECIGVIDTDSNSSCICSCSC